MTWLRQKPRAKERNKGLSLQLTSNAFEADAEIPSRFTCEGENISPPLAWSGAPSQTRSFVLIADDPDAPDPQAPRMTWVHWVLYNIPGHVDHLPEGTHSLPPGTIAGMTDFKRSAYGGPCPPIGRHRYFFKIYALDSVLPDLGSTGKTQIEQAMAGHILAQAQLMGTYLKQR